MSFDFNVAYSSRWGYSLINTLKLQKNNSVDRLQTKFAAKQVLKSESRHFAAAISLQVPKSCTDLDPTFLSILIWRTHTKFVWKSKMLASFASRNPARVLAAGLTRQDDVWITTKKFVCFRKNEFDGMLDYSEYSRFSTKHLPSGRVGFCWNALANLAEFSLQSISSSSFLWKRINCSVVIQTWSWRGKPAASARAWLWEANAER